MRMVDDGTTARWKDGGGWELNAVCFGRLEWQRRGGSIHTHTLVWHKLS